MHTRTCTVTGPRFDEAVQNLMAMGFDRTEVVEALRNSFNNPDRAAEYLMNVSGAIVFVVSKFGALSPTLYITILSHRCWLHFPIGTCICTCTCTWILLILSVPCHYTQRHSFVLYQFLQV